MFELFVLGMWTGGMTLVEGAGLCQEAGMRSLVSRRPKDSMRSVYVLPRVWLHHQKLTT